MSYRESMSQGRVGVLKYLVLASLIIGCVACGESKYPILDGAAMASTSSVAAPSREQMAADDLIRATGVWELEKRKLPDSYQFADVVQVKDEILVASGTTISEVECDPSLRPFPEGTVTASVTINKFAASSFKSVAKLDIVDANLNAVYIADVTGDGIGEVLVALSCFGSNYATSAIRAYQRGSSSQEWAEMPSTGADTFENGMLTTFEKDCQPDCARGGYDKYRISWNGAAFVKDGLITEDGTLVDLAVTESCPKFKIGRAHV